jgi:hypothetical protein
MWHGRWLAYIEFEVVRASCFVVCASAFSASGHGDSGVWISGGRRRGVHRGCDFLLVLLLVYVCCIYPSCEF